MKKVIAWLLVLALTASISIGATLAYLTDTDEDVNVMTLGNVKIDQLEYERIDDETANEDAKVQEFHDNKPLLPAVTDKNFDYTPGDTYVDWDQIGKDGYTSEIWNPEKINNELDKMVFIKNKGKSDAYVRSIFAFEAGKYTTLDEFRSMMHLNLNETDFTWDWVETPVEIPNAEGGTTKYFVATATYNKVLAPGALTEISLSQIALDKTATNEDVEAFGDTYQILVKSQGIQAEGFTDAATALNEGFGFIDATDIPWKNDSSEQGATLRNALHYLGGDMTGTKITANVTNVVFGLDKDYATIVDNYDSTLVDVEQDVSVYAYYVPDGSNYDVYFLAADTIYAPKDSNALFMDMTSLKTLNAANLSTSRTENMMEMFRNCTALTSVDVSNWDTSNVTSMKNMFRNCKVLPEIDLADWDVSNVTDMAAMFRECKAIKELDTAKWDVGNVTTFTQTFAICDSLETVHTSDWDISSATTTSWMFYKDGKLKAVDVSKWDTSNVTDMEYMFINCTQLAELEVGGWNTAKVKSFDHLFASSSQNKGDMKFTELDVSNWDTSSVTEMQCMFYGCGSLTELDLSKWDVSNVTIMTHMFADCFKLKDLNLVGWDTSSLVVMDAIFNDCDALETLDVSTFKTHNVTEFCQVFDDCESLVEIIGLNNWDTSKGCTFEEMFQGCEKLVALDLSSFDTANAQDNFKGNADTYNAFVGMFSATNNLEKLIISDKFDFDGNSTTNGRVSFPNPAAKEGCTAMWQNVDTKETYLAKDIPEGVAATYVVYYEYVPKGATMVDAIHYLNADSTGTKITDNVTAVVFGKNADYPQIVNNYQGYLADAEQDTPVYVYYVSNSQATKAAETYTVYFLADDVIYTPKNSYGLFNKMSNLESVNSSNLDTSRTESMKALFQKCVKLKSLDVSTWDVSNVTDFTGTFINCNILEELIGIQNWKTSSATTFDRMFANCNKLTSLDVSGWETSNVTVVHDLFVNCTSLVKIEGLENWDTGNVVDMVSMFNGCKSLTDVGDLSGWDMRKVNDIGYCFAYCNALPKIEGIGSWKFENLERAMCLFEQCYSLTELDIANWNMSKVQTFQYMFASPHANGAPNPAMKLTSLDLSKWDTSSAVEMQCMFRGCSNLTELNVSNWNVSKVTNFSSMFEDCTKLTSLDVSKWDTSSATNMSFMFCGDTSLTSLDVSKWNVGKVTDFAAMFQGAGSNLKDMKLEVLDVSNWRPVSAVYMNHMFYGCAKLKTMDLSGWNTPKLYTSSHMFADCTGLETLNLSGWKTTSTWYSMDAMFNECRKVKFLDVSTFNTSGVVEFSQLFENCTSLVEIKGLTNWNTAKGKSFDETFLNCLALKELDLSSWDTRSAMRGNKHLNGDISQGFKSTFSGTNNLVKLVLGQYFDFDGNGTVANVAKLPNPANINGQTAKWYNAENDTYYTASEIPDKTAATYVAAIAP